MIEVKNITHIYSEGMPHETVALNDVSFSVSEGQFVGVIGHTGSGKSTMLQHLNGLLKPNSGQIIIDGTDITAPGVLMRDIRRKVGFVFQYPEYQLFEETVAMDVAYGPKNLGLDEGEIDDRVREAIALVGLDYDVVKNMSPLELSGGQKRRVAIAGVLAMKPKILVLDEPTAGLNPKAHKEILDMIQSIRHKEGMTIVLVSHNMNDIARLSDKVLVMDKGRVALDGTPEEVFAHADELKSMGLMIPDAMEILEKLRQAGLELEGNAMDINGAADIIAKALTK